MSSCIESSPHIFKLMYSLRPELFVEILHVSRRFLNIEYIHIWAILRQELWNRGSTLLYTFPEVLE